jgi:CRP-like cAMP-binding protein
MAELNIVEKVIALEPVELLQNLKPEQLARVAAIAQEVRIPPGKLLMEAGKPLEALHVILDGAVEVSAKDQRYVAKNNEVLGAWALFDAAPIPLTAKTLEDTRVLRIAREDFYDLLSDNTEILAVILAALAQRFRKLVEA